MAETRLGRFGNVVRWVWERRDKPRSGSGPLARRFSRILRFGFAGILATILYFILVGAIVSGLGIDPVVASVYAYLISLVFSYLMQSRFTFRVREDTFGQRLRFVITSLCGLAISFGAMSFFVNVLELPYAAGAAAVCVLIPVTNYFVFQRWVFVRTHPAEDRLSRTGNGSGR